jgi:putative hemolysin
VNGTIANSLLVLLFILLGGVFAAAEISLVSLRETQVRAVSGRGRRGQKVAELAADPNRFLAAVQVGVTLAGFLSAAFGAATLAGDLSPVFRRWGMAAGVADTLALVSTTLVISYFSLVLGELAPKRLALQRAEGFALALAPTLERIATLSRPVIWLLSRSTDLVVRLLGGDPGAQRESMTEEELRDLVAGHETLGSDERKLIDEVFSAGERQLREVLVPRTEVEFIDASTPAFKAAKIALANPHSRYPVVHGSHDHVVGFVHVRDLFSPDVAGRSVRVGDLARDVKLLPATKRLLPALSEMRREGHHLAIVVDEYGGTAGIVTLEDLVEELVGDIRDEYDLAHAENSTRRFLGGEMEVDGLLNLDDFAEETGITLPQGPYETVAGFLLSQLGHLPRQGEHVDVGDRRFTVVELDGRRVARVRLTTVPTAGSAPGPTSGASTGATAGVTTDPVLPPAREPGAEPTEGFTQAAGDGAVTVRDRKAEPGSNLGSQKS